MLFLQTSLQVKPLLNLVVVSALLNLVCNKLHLELFLSKLLEALQFKVVVHYILSQVNFLNILLNKSLLKVNNLLNKPTYALKV